MKQLVESVNLSILSVIKFSPRRKTLKHVKSKTACIEIRKTLARISEYDPESDTNTNQNDSAEVPSQVSIFAQSEASLVFTKKGKFDICIIMNHQSKCYNFHNVQQYRMLLYDLGTLMDANFILIEDKPLAVTWKPKEEHA